MQTQNYQINTQKAARAERLHDYPMAAVYWNQAKQNASTQRQKHWAECRCHHCGIMAEEWDV